MHRPVLRPVVVLAAAVLGAVTLATLGPPSIGSAASPPAAAEVVHGAQAEPMVPVEPARLRIPAIDVDARVSELGLNPDRTLEVPTDTDVTGWWAGGSRPGDTGPAVLVGHIDSETGPAVFYRLRELEAGDEVEVIGESGDTARFRVESLATTPKDEFPTASVYGPTEGPTLRLVTCGGSFDDERQSYRDNTIAYAAPLST